MNKAEIGEMLKRMMGSGGAMGSRRCIYENDDILVVHGHLGLRRGEVDEAAPGLPHVRIGRLHHVEGAEQIDVDHCLEAVRADVPGERGKLPAAPDTSTSIRPAASAKASSAAATAAWSRTSKA